MKRIAGLTIGVLAAVTLLCMVWIPKISVSASGSSDGFEIRNGILASYSGTEKNIAIPSNVTEIGPEAFYNSKIETVTIPGTVKKIGSRAFYGCKGLYRVIIQNGVQEIGMSAFSFCTDLGRAVIPGSVNKIGAGAFSCCSSLSSLELSPDNRSFFLNDGVLYNQDSTTLVQYLAGRKATYYTMPFSVKKVEPYAFWGAALLTETDISNNVKEIGPYTFANCTGLRNIYLPESVTEIKENAFLGCSNLSYVGMELSSVKTDENAFKDCAKNLKTESGVSRQSFTRAKTGISQEPVRNGGQSGTKGTSSSGDVAVVNTISKNSVPGTETIPEINMAAPDGLLGASKIVGGNALVIISGNNVKQDTPREKPSK